MLIALRGNRAVGKTTVARYPAANYRIPHVDPDPILRGVAVGWDVSVGDEADGDYPPRSLQGGGIGR